MGIVRYNVDGSIDTTFGNKGIAVIKIGEDRGEAIGLGLNGLIYVAGTTGGDIALARLFGGGTFSYNPNDQFDYLATGEQAEDVFNYTISDGVLLILLK
jgi:hypothetical protein